MTTFSRKNAWNQGGTFDNADLLWYARGVGVLQSQSLDNPNSWWFFAAIHGEYINLNRFPGWSFIPGPPSVPTSPLPSSSIRSQFWNQCQHQSWYFAPWHRGYLVALEAQIRAAIIDLGGPGDWALPYWNYFGPNGQYKIPPAFTQQNLPDGKPNPLFVFPRFGPKGNSVIFVEVPPVAQNCQKNTIYTGSNAATPFPGYGGRSTGFSHSGQVSGNLENNPHNIVHGQVGGAKNDQLWGLMSDPGLAALDPIFYLHHCNIDRMWAAWNSNGNKNPTDMNWLNGPAAIGQRKFSMPMPDDSVWEFTPADVDSLDELDYHYDDLTTDKPTETSAVAIRLNKLGIQPLETFQDNVMDLGDNSELFGATDSPIEMESSGVNTTVKFDRSAWNKVPLSFENAATSGPPDQVYLQIENVKGEMDANIVAVSVNHQLAGHFSLFGLRNASNKDGHMGGSGLTFILDITDIIDKMHMENALEIDSLDVILLPSNAIPNDQKITIGRISLYREQQHL